MGGCSPGTCRAASSPPSSSATATRAGLDPAAYAGHSLRAGMITSAAEHGASVFKIQEVSRHKSINVLSGYVRRAPRGIPPRYRESAMPGPPGWGRPGLVLCSTVCCGFCDGLEHVRWPSAEALRTGCRRGSAHNPVIDRKPKQSDSVPAT